MKIILTTHGMESLRDRVKCSPQKYMKITTKAWYATERVADGEVANRRKYATEIYPGAKLEYRKLMGWIFVFEEIPRYREAVLITVCPNALRLARMKRTRRPLRPHK